jgi:hypothetical protein
MPAGSSPLRDIHDRSLRLREVIARLDDPGQRRSISALSLVFDDVTCLMIAEEDDSLSIASGPDPLLASGAASLSLTAEEPWSFAVGKPLLWSWSMTNQQGYRDGCQLEFAEDVTDQSVVIQIVVVGSSIKIRLMDEEFLPPPT